MDETNHKNVNYEKRASLFTLAWFLMCLYIGIIYLPEKPNWSGIGALLSGMFAPVAWVWFYVSYQLQRQELTLQRRELTLQRQALQQSVTAQQGSEKALSSQFDALKEQLNITKTQFDFFLEETEAKKPNFVLSNLRKFDLKYSDKVGLQSYSLNLLDLNIHFSDFKKDFYRPKSIHIAFEIRNIGGPCVILTTKNFTTFIAEYNDENHIIESGFRAIRKNNEGSIDCYLFNLEVYFNYNNLNIMSSKINFDSFVFGLVENISFELVCRNDERSFNLKYTITNQENETDLLKKFNSERIVKIKTLPVSTLLLNNYKLTKKK